MEEALLYQPPFDYQGLCTIYRRHSVGRLQWFEDEIFHRIIELDGVIGKISVGHDPSRSSLILKINFPDESARPKIVARVREMFDLDSNPTLIAESLSQDPKVKTILEKHPGIRLPSGWDAFEIAISTILGQLVSVERGSALVGDLIEMIGVDSGMERDGHAIKLFPTPQAIANSSLLGLKSTSIRKQTLISFSRAVAEGEVSLEPTQSVNEFINKIKMIRGIGPWTASYMAMKVLRHTDEFPETDLILARALDFHPKEGLEAMSPFRGYVAALFWREYAISLTGAKRKRKLN